MSEYVSVPREPGDWLLKDAVIGHDNKPNVRDRMYGLYRAMIAAAPAPPPSSVKAMDLEGAIDALDRAAYACGYSIANLDSPKQQKAKEDALNAARKHVRTLLVPVDEAVPKDYFGELCAVIFRDGGHKLAEVGRDAGLELAVAEVINTRARLAPLHAVAGVTEALRQFLANVADPQRGGDVLVSAAELRKLEAALRAHEAQGWRPIAEAPVAWLITDPPNAPWVTVNRDDAQYFEGGFLKALPDARVIPLYTHSAPIPADAGVTEADLRTVANCVSRCGKHSGPEARAAWERIQATLEAALGARNGE